MRALRPTGSRCVGLRSRRRSSVLTIRSSTRSYSLSLSVPPFLIAYSGVLFRRYPEEWQTLLDRGQGSYRRVTSSGDRPNLGTFKSQLTAALKLADDKAAASAISQAGFKQSTWWEDNKQGRDVSTAWKE